MTEAALASEAITIDPTTGLPELPEGQVWEVRRNDHYYDPHGDYHWRVSVPAYEVCIIEIEEWIEAVVHKEPNPARRWWNSQPDHIERVEEVKKFKKAVLQSERIVTIKAAGDLDPDEYRRLIDRDTRASFMNMLERSEFWTTYENTPRWALECFDFTFNEQTILDAAKRAITTRNEAIAERARKDAEEAEAQAKREAEKVRTEKLLGMYPPKKLEVA